MDDGDKKDRRSEVEKLGRSEIRGQKTEIGRQRSEVMGREEDGRWEMDGY
jgi:hypothetical protein